MFYKKPKSLQLRKRTFLEKRNMHLKKNVNSFFVMKDILLMNAHRKTKKSIKFLDTVPTYIYVTEGNYIQKKSYWNSY